MTKRNPEFDGFSAYFAVRAETDRKGKSTPPARTETPTYQQQMSHHNISTHSAHEDGDPWKVTALTQSLNFNPLRPRGRRLDYRVTITHTNNFNPLRPRGRRLFFIGYFTTSITFQPTPPTRTETKPTFWKGDIPKISTHSAHEDGDRRLTLSVLVLVKFQPTPPTRTETKQGIFYTTVHVDFNPLRPRGRRLSAYHQ